MVTVFDTWIIEKTRATQRAYRHQLGAFVRWLEARGVSREEMVLAPAPAIVMHVQLYLGGLKERGLSDASRRAARDALLRFYRYAMQIQLRPDNPIQLVEQVRVDRRRQKLKKRERLISVESLRAMVSDEANKENPAIGLRNAAILLVFGLSGLRLSELLGLRPRDLHQKADGVWWATVWWGKGEAAGEVPLAEEAVNTIRSYLLVTGRTLDCDRPLFLTRTGTKKMSTHAVQRVIGNAAERAGLKRISPHDLRHRAANTALAAGAPLDDIRKLLRHSAFNTTERYLHDNGLTGYVPKL